MSERIVGESYIKYDIANLYLPTILLRFKTQNATVKQKYSQIKLRLNYKNNEITEEMVRELRLKLRNICDLTYESGDLRCVYVGENRLFKTTIFANSKVLLLIY